MLEVFGSVPSRRLGQSLGVNNIPPKHCSYACVYCQLGKAMHMSARRKAFFSPRDLAKAVGEKLAVLDKEGLRVDYLTIVPDGEPTLDINLGNLILRLKDFPVPVAVISNGSLINDPAVQEALLAADWVSLKVDAISENVWRKIDRPHKQLVHEDILEGIREFARRFRSLPGRSLMTESMLVEGMNTSEEELLLMAEFIGSLDVTCSYLSIPTRPPAVETIRAAGVLSLARAYAIYASHIGSVEYIVGYEGNAFSNSGDSEADLLSITAVHPMREDAVSELLVRNGSDRSILEKLLAKKDLVASSYRGETFYTRNLAKRGES